MHGKITEGSATPATADMVLAQKARLLNYCRKQD
jgi:hypothetical protein